MQKIKLKETYRLRVKTLRNLMFVIVSLLSKPMTTKGEQHE